MKRNRSTALHAMTQLAMGRAGLGVAGVMVLAGCGGAAGPTAGTSAAAGSVQQQARIVWLDYARCVRAHGYPNFADPQVASDGSGRLVGGAQAKEAANAEQAACGSILGRLPAAAAPRSVTAAQLATERLLAACFRRHGMPQWPDPGPDGSFVLSGTPYQGTGPLAAAQAACRQYENAGGKLGS